VNKSSELVPFVHKIAQLKVHNAIQLQVQRGLPIRLIILKARQMGISTLIAGYNFESVNRRKNHHACIVSADDKATAKVFRMYETFQDEMPSPLETARSNRKEIVYAAPHRSSILCQTAGAKILGRGGTTQRNHSSEVAFWANAKVQMLGLLQEVPNIPESLVAIESTACGVGGEFHDRYWLAVDQLKHNPNDYSGYLPIFLPWYIDPEYCILPPLDACTADGKLVMYDEDQYLEQDMVNLLTSKGVALCDGQIYWRRLQIKNQCGGDLSLFKQENPSTAKEAFQSTGRMIFSPAALDRHESHCRPPERTIEFNAIKDKITLETVHRNKDCWKIWKLPQRNHSYIVYGDVCEGILADTKDPKSDPDSHYACVFDRSTKELVATYHGQCDTILYGVQMLRAAMFYNYAWASPEINSCGLAVLNELKRAQYPKIYQRRNKEEEYSAEYTDRLGYRTAVLNRKPGIECLKRVLADDDQVIYDKTVISECRTFINKNGRPEAEAGYHDDAVMMLVGTIQLHLTCPYDDGIMTQESVHERDADVEEMTSTNKLAVAGSVDNDEEDYDDDEY